MMGDVIPFRPLPDPGEQEERDQSYVWQCTECEGVDFLIYCNGQVRCRTCEKFHDELVAGVRYSEET